MRKSDSAFRSAWHWNLEHVYPQRWHRRQGKRPLGAGRRLDNHTQSDAIRLTYSWFVPEVRMARQRKPDPKAEALAAAAAAFGFSRPSLYAAAAALDQAGLPGLLPAKPGPRRAHKLSGEVVAFVQAHLAADPSTRPGELVDLIAERFGIAVHPRSIERALARRQYPKSPR